MPIRSRSKTTTRTATPKPARSKLRPVDFEGRMIEIGDVIKVADVDWSVGTAPWMAITRAIVTGIGRQRIEVRFEDRTESHFLTARTVRVISA